MTKKIVVTVSADGTISAESTGNAGPACLRDMETITELVDQAVVVGSSLTPEYYAQSTTTATVNQHTSEESQR